MDMQAAFRLNRQSTIRMENVVRDLSDEQLSLTQNNGWPIYVVLAHLAFWDQRVIRVVELAQKNNVISAPYFDDQINDILMPVLSVIHPVAARGFALKTANSLDLILEKCSRQIIMDMISLNHRLVERHLHRNHHLDALVALASPKKIDSL